MSVCYCNHTTNFAAIMDVNHREINETVKSVLTYICSSITIVMTGTAMYLSIKYHTIPRTTPEETQQLIRNKFFIHQNIYLWLIVSHLLVMFGMDRTDWHGVCLANSLLLFFSLLATFSFTLLMLIFLYRGSSEDAVFDSNKTRMFLLVGYSLPAVIVLLSVILMYATQSHELSENLCGEYL